MSALAQVVGSGVDDNGALVTVLAFQLAKSTKQVGETYADDALRANQLDELVCDASLRVTLTVGLEVTQVTNVALLILGSTVGLVVGVEMGTGRCAAVCVVAESVDVHAALSVGVVAGDVP